MILTADPHENWMPMKCWKIAELQKFQRETWRQCQEWLRNKEIELLNLRAALTVCPLREKSRIEETLILGQISHFFAFVY